MTHKVSSSKNSRRKPTKAWELLPASRILRLANGRYQTPSAVSCGPMQSRQSPRKNGHETSCNRDSRQSNTKQEKFCECFIQRAAQQYPTLSKRLVGKRSIRAFFLRSFGGDCGCRSKLAKLMVAGLFSGPLSRGVEAALYRRISLLS